LVGDKHSEMVLGISFSNHSTKEFTFNTRTGQVSTLTHSTGLFHRKFYRYPVSDTWGYGSFTNDRFLLFRV